MQRIQTLFQQPGKKLVPFITAGYPKADSTVNIVLSAEKAGADMVEIGMPFSDPLADGPVIQESSQVAIQNGMNLPKILQIVSDIRRQSDIPIVLMGYLNPIQHYGADKFFAEARDAGVDGLILPDLPPEEGGSHFETIRENGLSPILLVAPNSKDDRMSRLGELAGDLLYAVSILGVTGSAIDRNTHIAEYLQRIRKNTDTPFVVGFGISSPEDAREMAQHADGVVVGSALIKQLKNAEDPAQAAYEFLINLKDAIAEVEELQS
ncbi:MAG: tryptophan synthase subunit alpha [Candidatus Marinimicrobia bacterium]|nr:tryptophan synthase subunit alpha [Candidatus Neomarinimicrobiota bacterium]